MDGKPSALPPQATHSARESQSKGTPTDKTDNPRDMVDIIFIDVIKIRVNQTVPYPIW